MFEPINSDGQKQGHDQQERDCKFCVVNVHFVTGFPQKKGVNPNYCHNYTEIKYVKDVSYVGHKCPNCCHRSTCRGKATPVLGKMGSPGDESKGKNSSQGYTHPFLFRPNLTCHKQLCQPSQMSQPFGGPVLAGEQKCSRTGRKPKLPGVFQPAIFGTKTQQPVETYLGPEHLEHLPKHRVVQNEDHRDNKNLTTGRGVGNLYRFQGRILPHTNSQSRKYMCFHVQGHSYQFKALPFGLSTAPMEFTMVAKEVKLIALQKGIRIHRYLDDWLVRATSHQTFLQHTQTLVTLLRTRLAGAQGKVRTGLKQVFNFVGYQFDLKEGKVRPTSERWQSLIDKIQTILYDPVLLVRQFMSLIGLLKATEKQVHLGRLHVRPIQLQLKKELEGTRITRQGDTSPQVAPPPLKVVAGGKQCTTRSTITPTKTCSADIYRYIKRRVGRSLK